MKAGWTRGVVFSNPIANDVRLQAMRAQRPKGGAGTGIPFIQNGFTVGTLTFHVNYPVAD